VAEADKGLQMEGCASWMAVFYQSDGHYLHGETTGRWKLAGNRLEKRKLVYAEGGGDEEQEAEAADTAKIVRLSDNRLREVGSDGQATTYLRCPKPETPVAR